MTKRREILKMGQPKTVTRIEEVSQLGAEEREQLREVTDKFRFRANEYYFSLINWDDPNDPLRRIVVPSVQELSKWGSLDPSDEKRNVDKTGIKGLQHKYPKTVLMQATDSCECICRFCFRKRVFGPDKSQSGQREVIEDWTRAFNYIRQNTQIDNAILSGGDPFTMPIGRLEEIIKALREIEHVKIIRIGTKVPVYNPYRIIDNPELGNMLTRYMTKDKPIYVIIHFVHHREITDGAKEAVAILSRSGAKMRNQTPIIRGVSDTVEALVKLFNELSYITVTPYYCFQCRPVLGNKPYSVPVEESYEVVTAAQDEVSGLAQKAEFAMSHKTGKIQVVGLDDEHVYMRYRRAADPRDKGKFMKFRRNPEAMWFDDYKELEVKTSSRTKS